MYSKRVCAFPKSSSALTVCMLVALCIGTAVAEAPGDTNSAGVADTAPYTQPFKAGDAVKILVFPDTSTFLNGTYHISTDGSILLPFVGRVKITDMTHEELSRFLNETFVDHLPYPNAQVVPLIRIALVGGWQRPGIYYIDPHQSLWDAVALAGAPQREDGITKMRWKRSGVTVKRNVTPLFESGQSLYALGFRSGDQLRVSAKPAKSAWEVIKTDVIPLLTVSLSTVMTGLTLYQIYENWE